MSSLLRCEFEFSYSVSRSSKRDGHCWYFSDELRSSLPFGWKLECL